MKIFPYVKEGTYLFRYLNPLSEHFWPAMTDMLSKSMLFLNSRKNFNDPYDSQPLITSDISNSAIRDYFEDMMERPYHPKRSLSGVARIYELKASGRTSLNKNQIESIRDGLRKNAVQLLDNAGLLSFSLTAENPLLWGHYAASFTGVCVVFRRGGSLSINQPISKWMIMQRI